MLYYSTVIIHHLLRTNNERICSQSGIYLYDDEKKSEMIMTLTYYGVEQLNKMQFLTTNASMISEKQIHWVESTNYKLMGLSIDNFYELLGTDFEFSPDNDNKMSILVIEISRSCEFNKLLSNSLRPFSVRKSIDINDSILIKSSPFSLSNVSLFSEFLQTTSVISEIRINRSRDKIGWLCDLKYLDNMVGGVAMGQTGEHCFGMVACSIKKKNGEGEVLFLLSLELILGEIQKVLSLNVDYALDYKFNLDAGSKDGVVGILLRNSYGQVFWGTGIILDNNMIITNQHVLNRERISSTEIFFAGGISIRVDEHDRILTPFKDIDLSFIKLNVVNHHEVTDMMRPVKLATSNINIGDPITSVGYGLVFNRFNASPPMVSRGTVNMINKQQVFQHSMDRFVSMMIVSSSCWNGSSGGGIFNERNELVGIICCNGRLTNGEILTRFGLCLSIDLIREILSFGLERTDGMVKDMFEKTWKLRETHTDLVMNSKL